MGKPDLQIISTTADMGFIVLAEELPALFELAAEALLGIMGEVERVKPLRAIAVDVAAGDWPELAVAWLNEIIYQQEARAMVFSRTEIKELEEGRLKALLWGEAFDGTRHIAIREVKAATYHGLELGREPGGNWRLRVIVDI